MASLANSVREKRNILREIYGGMMSMSDLGRELNMKPENARLWAEENGLAIQIGKRVKVESDMVAKFIVQRRGMC